MSGKFKGIPVIHHSSTRIWTFWDLIKNIFPLRELQNILGHSGTKSISDLNSHLRNTFRIVAFVCDWKIRPKSLCCNVDLKVMEPLGSVDSAETFYFCARIRSCLQRSTDNPFNLLCSSGDQVVETSYGCFWRVQSGLELTCSWLQKIMLCLLN